MKTMISKVFAFPFHLVLAIAFASVKEQVYATEPINPTPPPLQGAVCANKVVTAFADRSDPKVVFPQTQLDSSTLDDRTTWRSPPFCYFTALGRAGFSPVPQWKVAEGRVWAVSRSPIALDKEIGPYYLYAFHFDPLLHGRRFGGPTATPVAVDDLAPGRCGCFATFTPLISHCLCCRLAGFRAELFMDFLPVTKDELRLFVLSNVNGQLKPTGTSRGLTAVTADREAGWLKKPRRTLWVYHLRAKWSKAEGHWEEENWTPEEEFPAPQLGETFTAYSRGMNYYFLTISGRLYVAQPSGKGLRKLRTVPLPAGRPVSAVLTDVDGATTYFFCPADRLGGAAAFFELSDAPAVQMYDAALAGARKGEEPLAALVRYANVLRLHRKVRGK